MNSKKSVFCAIFICFLSCLASAFAQDTLNIAVDSSIFKNSSKINADSLIKPTEGEEILLENDSLSPQFSSVREYKVSKDTLDAPINYNARDSIVYDIPGKRMLLYGDAVVVYKDVTVSGGKIIFNWGTSEVEADYGIDSAGQQSGKPQFKQAENVFQADGLRFNFKSKKGYSNGMITSANEGFLHAEILKNVNDSVLFGKSVKYTSCEYDHPHFYIEVNQAKIIKDKIIVGKPANLVIEDVRTPLFLPFGVFPILKKRTSGLILPRFGESQEFGFFAQGLGYYWAINDNIDLTATADIYTQGSFAASTDFNFNKRYKYAGALSLSFSSLQNGERRTPSFTKPSRDFFVNMNMRMDPKRMFNSNFSASIYAGTRTFHQRNVSDAQTFLNNTYRSSVAYQKWWPGKPFRMSVSASHNQNTQTKDFSIQAPQFNFAVTRINPFQRKVPTGGRKWYENFGLSYTLDMQNQLNTKDSLLKKPETYRNMQNGIRHSIPVSGTINIAKYLNFTTSFDYNERWYFQYEDRNFVTQSNGERDTSFVKRDTLTGFKQVRDFGLSAGFQTRLFGMVQFKKGKLKAIRHVFTPSIGFNYRPDFGKEKWGYYGVVQTDTSGKTETYNRFPRGIYGNASRGEVGGISFNFTNNLEIKVFSKKDSVNNTKKIVLLENLNFSTFYNFIADSFQLNPIRFSGNTRISQYLVINFNGSLDAYLYNKENNRRINQLGIANGGPWLRLTDFSLTLNGSWQSKNNTGKPGDTFDPRVSLPTEPDNINGAVLQDQAFGSPLAYVNFDIPLSINYSYTLGIRRSYVQGRDTTIINQTLGANFNFSLTPKWKIGVNSGFDFVSKKINRTDITVYRDLHCWQLAFNWVPLGFQRSFSIELNVKSQILKDLKLSKRKNWFDYGDF